MKRPEFLLVVACLVAAAGSGWEAWSQEKTEKTPAGEKEATSGDEQGSSGELPQGVLVRLNGRDITLDDYIGYLLATLGKSKLDEYIDRLLIDEEARRLKVAVTPEQIEAAVEEIVNNTVKAMYGGSEGRLLETLKKRRITLDEYKARLRQDHYYDRLYEAVIIQQRTVDDGMLRREFELTYGKGGVQHVLRHILVATRPAAGGGVTRAPQKAKERAEKILKEIQGGKDFVQAVKEYSDDAYTRPLEGRILLYRENLYGSSFHQAVLRLTPEDAVSPVVESPRGYHLIQLMERQVTKFEDVRKDLEQAVKNKPPSRKEKNALLLQLRQKAKIEGLDSSE